MAVGQTEVKGAKIGALKNVARLRVLILSLAFVFAGLLVVVMSAVSSQQTSAQSALSFSVSPLEGLPGSPATALFYGYCTCTDAISLTWHFPDESEVTLGSVTLMNSRDGNFGIFIFNVPTSASPGTHLISAFPLGDTDDPTLVVGFTVTQAPTSTPTTPPTSTPTPPPPTSTPTTATPTQASTATTSTATPAPPPDFEITHLSRIRGNAVEINLTGYCECTDAVILILGGSVRGPDDLILGSFALESGSTNARFGVPTNISPGAYHIYAVPDGDTDDPTLSVEFTVLPPFFEINGGSNATSGFSGSHVRMLVGGYCECTDAVTLILGGSVRGPDDLILDSVTLESSASGSRRGGFNFNLPTNIPPGVYHIYMVPDGDTNDPTLSVEFTIIQTPTSTATAAPTSSPTSSPTPAATLSPTPIVIAAGDSGSDDDGDCGGEHCSRLDHPEPRTRELRHVAELPADVVTPIDISLDTAVVGSNFLLALLLALLFGTTQAAFDGTVEARERAFRGRLPRLTGWVGALRATELLSRFPRIAMLVLAPLVLIVYGLAFSILDSDHGVPSKELLFLVLSLGLSVGIIELGDDVGKWWWARRLGASSKFVFRPVNMAVAFGVAAASRVLAVVPGFIIGVPGGVEVDDDHSSQREKALFPMAGWIGVLVFATLAWILSAFLTVAASNGTRILGIEAPYIHDFLLIVWLTGIEIMFFDMVPWWGTGGHGLYRYSKVVWAVAFGLIGFMAWHTLLNPNANLIEVFSEARVGVVLAVIAVFSIGMLLFWLWQIRGLLSPSRSRRSG